MEIKTISIAGLDESVMGSKFPMSTDTDKLNSDVVNRTKILAGCDPGTGHDNFLNGIMVYYDISMTVKAWIEYNRYHYNHKILDVMDYISSQSTMHCASKFDIEKQCCEYVTQNTIDEANRLKEIYLETKDIEDYRRLLYNLPQGFILKSRMVSNYRQLKTMYMQRKNHRLLEWKEFCKWCETLPYFKEWIADSV